MREDLLTGIAEIADFCGFDEAKTARLHRQKLLPTFTRARTIYALRSQIRAAWRNEPAS
ncbi:hypothetical protein [Sphingomonas sp. BAUL-RG-20F-R05-02]|uniref:hypothetical protein n=1 Tax=Sphingomonas sp. BAUL-RG-20F-R05-02 TaxID=2914830 RepID=UPI001F56BC5D|nr:hypothetical protein [Sphingomonas sp. BAUL-RG-20F-R05-02]